MLGPAGAGRERRMLACYSQRQPAKRPEGNDVTQGEMEANARLIEQGKSLEELRPC